MRITPFYILVLMFLFSFHFGYSQNNFSGIVLDYNNNPLPGADIQILGTNQFTYTDLEGKFSVLVKQEQFDILVSYIGFEDKKLSIDMIKSPYIEIVLDNTLFLNEIVVNANLEGQSKALNVQRNKINMSNIVSEEQFSRFPDANMGDALKRLPGINVQYDQGEARFANIRGTSPELNSITLNGERVPSAEAEKRFVQLDLIPSDMVETIEVNKAVTPDMDADAIGGSINLVTKNAGKNPELNINLGSGYSFLTEKPIFKTKIQAEKRFFENKLGIILDASLLNRFTRSDDIEAEWNYSDENNKNSTAFTEDFQIRQYAVQRFRQSYSGQFDYNINQNHNLKLGGMYTKREDWENRYRYRIKDIEEDGNAYVGTIERETKGGSTSNKGARLEDQQTYSLNLGGEHKLNRLNIDWSIAKLHAQEDRPHERYINYRLKNIELKTDWSNNNRPLVSPLSSDENNITNYKFKEVTEEFQHTEESDFNTRINFDYLLSTSHSLKFGIRTRNKSKMRENTLSEFEPIDEDAFNLEALSHLHDATNDNYMPGSQYRAGEFVSKDYLGSINFNEGFEESVLPEGEAGNFDAEEKVNSAYVMLSSSFSQKLNTLIGLRVEKTNNTYSGKIFDGETISNSEVVKSNYTDLLPGIHIKYSPSDWSNIRFAWTNTLARPNYFDLVPYQQINTEDNEISIGNPNLKTTKSANLDLMGELYFKNIGLISLGVYYKNISQVIAVIRNQNIVFNGIEYDLLSQPVNTGDADLIGLEFSFQRRLSFLPSFLKNFSLLANVSYNHSKLKNITLENREDENLKLSGTPDYNVNLSLAYDISKLDFRLSFHTAGNFIEEYGGEAFFDRYYDKVDFMDFNFNFNLNDSWNIYGSVNNILNQPLRYFQGIESRTMQEEYYGINTRLGIKFRLK